LNRILLCVLCLCPLFGGSVLSAQQPDSSAHVPAQPPPAEASVAPRIDPEKKADIRRFMRLTGQETIEKDLANEMKGLLRLPVENSLPPGEYRAEVVDLLLEKFGTRFATGNSHANR